METFHEKYKTGCDSVMYSRVRNKRSGTFINLGLFFRGYIYSTFFPLAMYKNVKLSVIKGKGTTLIQGATFILFHKYSRGYVYSVVIEY